ncbi:hypothetical protein HNR06_003600 [Nocardiopsis arvandica]|uniref:Uncharacterized protein n=1 Tax=Nocardiopsis sinuspersici TaxID=501010 RepID=A0A7Y9XDW1_9ACTN|nr:hypothetical protein [Nocardiopsis sinuspersici]NYH54011.1 hypothetical protein [Nocardiopsis sinuspersici]
MRIEIITPHLVQNRLGGQTVTIPDQITEYVQAIGFGGVQQRGSIEQEGLVEGGQPVSPR